MFPTINAFLRELSDNISPLSLKVCARVYIFYIIIIILTIYEWSKIYGHRWADIYSGRKDMEKVPVVVLLYCRNMQIYFM